MKINKWLQQLNGLRLFVPSLFVAGMCMLPAHAFAASSYLQELEAEAARTTTEQDATSPSTPEQRSDWRPKQQNLSEKLEQGLSKAQFEERLKESYYGSYLFYSTLSDAAQQRVYEDYRQHNDIDSVRESIKRNLKAE